MIQQTHIKNMNNTSPLGCCIPKDDRTILNPVFKQQYINDSGKIKMTMPKSPMHYINNTNYYNNDTRYPPMRWDNNPIHHQHYEYSTIPNGTSYDVNDDDGFAMYNRRLITPSMSFITQLKRQTSHAKNPNPPRMMEPKDHKRPTIESILYGIDGKLLNIMKICEANEEIIIKLLSHLNLNNTSNDVKGMKINENNAEEIERSPDDDKSNNSPDVVNTSILISKLGPTTTNPFTSTEIQSNSSPLGARLADSSFNYLSLKGDATPRDRGGEKVVTVTSSGMKNSTGPRVEPAADLREAKGEVIRGADGRTSSGNGMINLGGGAMETLVNFTSDKFITKQVSCNEEDENVNYNINSDCINMFQPSDTGVPSGNILSNIEKGFKKLMSNFESKNLTFPSNTCNDPSSLQLTGDDYQTDDLFDLLLINGKLDLTRRIRDVNLTEDELKYLQAHKFIDDARNKLEEQEQEQEARLTCDLLPSTRVFDNIIQQDSIHGLNSMKIE